MRRAAIISAAGVLGLGAATLAVTATVTASAAASSATVAKDGSGNYTTVQAAVNAAPANSSSRFTINVKPGTYQETVSVPANKPNLSFVGKGSTSSDVVITQNHAAGQTKPGGGTYGTNGSASVTIQGAGFQASSLTFANSFDEASSSISSKQAVAVLTQADKIVFDNVRMLGNQDTFWAESPSKTSFGRVYLRKCYIEGDVDFIFGSATAVFDQCTIKSLNRGSSSNNGYVVAPSTQRANSYGFLFNRCTLTSNAAAKTVYLGRPWHPSGDANAIGQVLIRESTLGAHIRSDPWTDMSGFSWKEARFFEYSNSGSGAGSNGNRPQLPASQAGNYTAARYLAGSDGWNPIS